MRLDVNEASWEAEGKRIIDSIELSAQSGEIIGLVGPNGSGKSSLLRLVYRLYPPSAGAVFLDRRDLWSMSARETARKVAVVAQEHAIDFDFTVQEIVSMGRTPHKGLLEGDTSEDDRIVQSALERVGMLEFAWRSFGTLSGGEKQRALIARALAQRARVMVLDEPTNHLDIRYQIEIMDLVRSLGVTTVAALHDLNLAAAYCDRIYLIHMGRICASGSPREVLTPARIEFAFGVHAEVETRLTTGQLHIVFVRSTESTRSSVYTDRRQNGP